ncbi:TPA: hypothetical protein GHF72_05380 [Providencia stuartii]|nr:hypothetical protein [Providencia stuartii]
MPSSPANIPINRNITSIGKPSRAESLLEKIPSKISMDVSNISCSIVGIIRFRLEVNKTLMMQ